MTDETWDRIALYLYGELDEAEQAAFEAEAAESAELRRAIEADQRMLHGLYAARTEAEPNEALLADCRRRLMKEIRRDAPPSGFAAWRAALSRMLASPRPVWQPAAAALLLALGFWGGRATQGLLTAPVERAAATPEAAAEAPADFFGARQQGVLAATPAALGDIQAIYRDPGGAGIEIVVEERRTIRGDARDPAIRGLLLSSIETAPSGARLESMEALGGNLDDAEVRLALIRALRTDRNPGVRLKALEALGPRKAEPDVRAALIDALRRDENPGVRVMAVDLLTSEPSADLADALREAAAAETNGYVRMRCQRALLALDAGEEF